MTATFVPRFLRQLQFREVVASVSLSHPAKCECDICKAAHGDEAALVRLMEESEQVGERDG